MASVWNTGSWHWEERDYGEWTKNRLKEVLVCVLSDFENGKVEITSVSVDGDATSNIRKGKKIVGYELSITAVFNAEMAEGDKKTTVSGKYKLPYVCEDVEGRKFEIEVSFNKRSGSKSDDTEEEKKEHQERVAILEEKANQQWEKVLGLVNQVITELEEK